MASNDRTAVLITGCSDGGIGSALAVEFQRRNYRVFASLRNKAKATALANLPNVELVTLDVTSTEQIAAAVDLIRSRNAGKLDILVNNSGQGYITPLLDASLERARELYEVNVWGSLAMTQAFAPLLIAAKGTIVNVSSVGSRLTTPFTGIYMSSKAAITSMSEVIRLELEPLGVRVVTLQAGVVKTAIYGNNSIPDLPTDSHYLPAKDHIAGFATGKGYETFQEADVFAANVVTDVEGGASGLLWRGKFATVAKTMSTFAPSFLFDRAARNDSGLDLVAKAHQK